MTITIDASQNHIKAVSVFSSRKAEVIRTFTVQLEEGQNELSITSLPSCIDTDSARVTGLGDAVLFDVVCTIDDKLDSDDSTSAVLDTLQQQRSLLQGEKDLKGKTWDILEHYGRTLDAEHATPDTVVGFLDSLSKRGSSTLKDVNTLDGKTQELDKEIAKERRRVEKQKQKAATLGRVAAVIMAKRVGRIEITLTYMVNNATWSPSYDLRATTEDGRPSGTVSFQYRASIQQNTGEDWRDTVVTVSTAKPGSWSSIPDLRGMKISPSPIPYFAKSRSLNSQAAQPTVLSQAASSFRRAPSKRAPPHPPPPPPAPGAPAPPGAAIFTESRGSMSAVGGFGTTRARAEGANDWDGDSLESEQEVTGNGAWAESKAVVTESAVSSSFRIEGNCTIPSEPTAHKVAIAVLSFTTTVNYITVPRSTPTAFLECEVKNTSEYRLLPGSVNVFLDNSPVSKTTIKDVNREEVFKCTLGPDPSLRVKFTRLPRTVTSSGSAFTAQKTLTTYRFSTTVHNVHTFAIKGIQVRDAAPTVDQSSSNSNTQGIRVVVKRPDGLGEASPGTLVDVPNVSSSNESSVKVKWEDDGGEKEGKYVWIVDLGAGGEAKLEAEYEVRAPADFLWELQEGF